MYQLNVYKTKRILNFAGLKYLSIARCQLNTRIVKLAVFTVNLLHSNWDIILNRNKTFKIACLHNIFDMFLLIFCFTLTTILIEN